MRAIATESLASALAAPHARFGAGRHCLC
jgi:hypothetical protein